MKKLGYILAAICAVFSLSVTSLADDLAEDLEDAVDTVASDAEGALDDMLGDDSDTTDAQDDPTESGSDTQADDPADEGSDITTAGDTGDNGSDVTTDDSAATTPPTNVSSAGSKNPSTGAGTVLGFTALGMAAAGLTAAAARKRK